ncbi:hypothetical protein BO94DRAFT_130081 [Aspergillus sclerotioniger CBS 115572]|uniref:Ankyrin n=1 Tax=Aspergillus sclerotioniger CBS 115572 TaxID=1450535 RepID=A0A317XAF3_9EURO|nr:hypothetical protein BO94DRAFT_130081 [Aspergillus sclerotioniger CBS 115572]PWY95566.1 hypothetical protein BO94DRAFT_130081 [Aspergillus sclerotioniger CBS 115572]
MRNDGRLRALPNDQVIDIIPRPGQHSSEFPVSVKSCYIKKRQISNVFFCYVGSSILQGDIISTFQLLQHYIQLDHKDNASCSPGTPLGAAIEVGGPELISRLLHGGAYDLGTANSQIGNLQTARYLAEAGTLHRSLLNMEDRIWPMPLRQTMRSWLGAFDTGNAAAER